MKKIKVVKIGDENLTFNNGTRLESYHSQDCCEYHYLDFGSLDITDFEDLEFDLSQDSFFSRIEDFGICLNPLNGHPVRVAGYGSNNGYYSSDIQLMIKDKNNKIIKEFDVSECQKMEGY